MIRRSFILTVILALALMLAACGNDRDSAAHDTADGAEAGQVVDDGQSATGPELEPTQGVGEPSTSQAEENSTPEAGADSATGGQVVEQGEDPDDDDGAASDAAALIGALNIPLPEGATIVSVDDSGDDVAEPTYEVPNMSPEQVMTFFRDNLPGAGYEIQSEGDDEIEFVGNDRTAKIEVSAGQGGGTQFKIEIDD